MGVLVDYRCRGCGARTEHWVARPVPAEAACGRCGAPARRQFGGALLTGAPEPRPVEPRTGSGGACGHAPGIPGTCTLTPTAARMLTARARGDNRALEREIAYQEKAIKAGTLDPNASVVTTFAGGPVASTPAPAPAQAPSSLAVSPQVVREKEIGCRSMPSSGATPTTPR
ncbi:zinc ribbon domain-containing protein [Pseudonocardia acidicola]|uniref:Zinc ribbon domain-containing protein n=1 Tax=Pseudonocardia acidicola TaxID=2724939 RepID=A0ABX1S300_9PSEU|nr:zinc ribbon domain-containing protein [Pseudonocardia acidicola]NMH95934.1 zinc ribbon domain-containing protein [Pseudonocardia acidicola]